MTATAWLRAWAYMVALGGALVVLAGLTVARNATDDAAALWGLGCGGVAAVIAHGIELWRVSRKRATGTRSAR